MESVATLGWWLKRGSQRSAVARVLRKPMTGSEICREARRWNPRIQLRDVWYLMRQLTWRGLVLPLNRHGNSGRLYFWTDHGCAAAEHAFGVTISPAPTDVNWRKYADVVRAGTRRKVFVGLGNWWRRTREPPTATELRRHLRQHHALGLSSILRSLHELESMDLVRSDESRTAGGRRRYKLTFPGWRILEQLER